LEPQNSTISRFYYEVQIEQPTKLFINLHQDDDIYKENDSRKQRMDLSITILKLENSADEITHIESTDFLLQQSILMEKNLEAGTYIILPRTTGCSCFGKEYSKEKNPNSRINLYDKEKNKLTPVFINILKDIFNKLDMGMNKGLKFEEFKAFWKTILEEDMSEDQFKKNILNKYSSSSDLLTEKGFIQFFKEMLLTRGEVNSRIYNQIL